LGSADRLQDAELVARTLAGEITAFEHLVRRYRGLAFAFAYHQLGRFDDAEDAAQEAMVEAYVKLRHLRNPERFVGWLRRIVVGKAVEAARRRREEPLAPDIVEACRCLDEPSPAALDVQVWEALYQLSPPVRLATTLYYVDDLSYREIGDLLGVPVSTVRGRLQRARAFLRGELVDVVAAGLHRARPGEAFTERVMSKIQSIQVYQQIDAHGQSAPLLHLMDGEGRRLNI
jgi:RNA polymerase sigma-70 factor, ECF subfamily